MSGWRLWVAVVVVGFLLGSALAWLTNRNQPGPPVQPAGIELGQARPDFALENLDGQLIHAGDFSGQVMLVNFWATWCAPCVREMPVLQAASERWADSLAVVGIALDDPEPVARFVEQLGIGYIILAGQDDVFDVMREWGNDAGAMPYTVVVDAAGIVRWRHYGEVTAEQLEPVLAELMPAGAGLAISQR